MRRNRTFVFILFAWENNMVLWIKDQRIWPWQWSPHSEPISLAKVRIPSVPIRVTWLSCWSHWHICRTWLNSCCCCFRYLSSCRLLSWRSSRRLSIFRQLFWAPWIISAFTLGPSHLIFSMKSVSCWLLFKRARDRSKSSRETNKQTTVIWASFYIVNSWTFHII